MSHLASDLVVADIGGTHARFALAQIASDGSISLGEPITLHTDDHASLQTAWEDFRKQMGGTLPRAVSMAIAGPVGDPADEARVIKFTNNPWLIRPALIKPRFDVDSYILLNDFEAVAHAVARAPVDTFIHLSGPDHPFADTGTLSVVGPGTGLGVAHLHRMPNGQYHVQATEGGHGDFAPLDPIEDAILARLRKRHGRVSVERVVSGPAIVDIYETLGALESRTLPERDDVEIWTRGLSGEDSLAVAAIDRFCLSLGSAAGDIALVQGGFAGVAIAGGLGARLHETLLSSGFAERFRAKGRYQDLMASIPVKLITHPQPGLYGAAAAYASQSGSI